MADSKQKSPILLGGSYRPLWRRPAFLAALALLLLLVLAWSGSFSDPQPTDAPRAATGSPAGDGADLQWPDAAGAANAPARPEASIDEPVAPGRSFIERLNLQPRMQYGRINGYIVRPDDPTILNGTPLQSGDVLLEVDGLALDPARAAQLAKNVGEYQDVFVRLERGNRQQEGILSFGTR